MSPSKLVIGALLFIGILADYARAGDTGLDILVRAKAGVGLLSNTSHSAAFTYGFDIGTVFWNGFGVTASVATGANSSPTERLTSFTLTPNYTIRKEGVALYIGPTLGGMMSAAATTTTSQLALGATVGLDIPMTEYAFFATSVQYLAALGAGLNPSVASFLGGVGYRF